jgi:hypothetical protein
MRHKEYRHQEKMRHQEYKQYNKQQKHHKCG